MILSSPSSESASPVFAPIFAERAMWNVPLAFKQPDKAVFSFSLRSAKMASTRISSAVSLFQKDSSFKDFVLGLKRKSKARSTEDFPALFA
ncbi:MAG: hypothetical protein ACREDQ_11830, partial [Limisphaerales bacterium]